MMYVLGRTIGAQSADISVPCPADTGQDKPPPKLRGGWHFPLVPGVRSTAPSGPRRPAAGNQKERNSLLTNRLPKCLGSSTMEQHPDLGWPDMTPDELVESERQAWLEEQQRLVRRRI